MAIFSPTESCKANAQPAIVSLGEAQAAVEATHVHVTNTAELFAKNATAISPELLAAWFDFLGQWNVFFKRAKENFDALVTVDTFGWGSALAEADIARCRCDKLIEKLNAETGQKNATTVAPVRDIAATQQENPQLAQISGLVTKIAIGLAIVFIAPSLTPLLGMLTRRVAR